MAPEIERQTNGNVSRPSLTEFFDLAIKMRESSFKRLPMIWISGVLEVVLDARSR